MIGSQVVLMLAASIVGCGGTASSGPEVPSGRYVGNWSGVDGDNGTIDLTINDDRSLSGSINTDLGSPFTGAGQIDGSAALSGRTTVIGLWPSFTPNVPYFIQYEGKLRFDPHTGTLQGTLDRGRGEVPIKSRWTLTKQ